MYICIFTRVYTYIHVYMYIHMCKYVYIYTYMCTYKYTYTYVYMFYRHDIILHLLQIHPGPATSSQLRRSLANLRSAPRRKPKRKTIGTCGFNGMRFLAD